MDHVVCPALCTRFLSLFLSSLQSWSRGRALFSRNARFDSGYSFCVQFPGFGAYFPYFLSENGASDPEALSRPSLIDIFVSSTGNSNISIWTTGRSLRNISLVGNIGHFDEIDFTSSEGLDGMKVRIFRCSRFQKLCRMLLGFLLFAMTLMPLVSCVQLRRSVRTRCLRKDCHTLSRFQITRRTSPCFEKLLKILAALVQQRNTSTLCCPVKGCESLNAQDIAVHLTAETGHHFEDVMANCRPLGIAEQVAGTSSNTQSAFRQLWWKYSVDLHQQCVHDGRRRRHILSSSVLQYFRVPAFRPKRNVR